MGSTDIFCFTVYCALGEGASEGPAAHSAELRNVILTVILSRASDKAENSQTLS